MITNYLFDVDGTLTPARSKITDEFKSFFTAWVANIQSQNKKVYLVTGSDRQKTRTQLPILLLRTVDGVYQNSGSQLYVRNNLRWEKNWQVPDSLIEDLNKMLKKSKWYGRAENNIEYRRGEMNDAPMMINFSTIGRSASIIQRREYYEWDNRNSEREKIVDSLSKLHPELDFDIGGEISIDIYPKGRDKSQVLSDMQGDCMFFGDRCDIGGNDYKIAVMCKHYFNVSGWEETHEILAKML